MSCVFCVIRCVLCDLSVRFVLYVQCVLCDLSVHCVLCVQCVLCDLSVLVCSV